MLGSDGEPNIPGQPLDASSPAYKYEVDVNRNQERHGVGESKHSKRRNTVSGRNDDRFCTPTRRLSPSISGKPAACTSARLATPALATTSIKRARSVS